MGWQAPQVIDFKSACLAFERLSRRSSQALVIDGRVKVTVLRISTNHVELGVEAPPQVAVDREEVHLRKQRQRPVVKVSRAG